ncbi:MAG TPA: chaperone modulator CbpM [Isosphaeraceae bacterium]|jgi:MerR family transcriptional regulator/heat shock protein HspR|nr:chaperone modulator CbpM [Isosphaeraceae bacterium]
MTGPDDPIQYWRLEMVAEMVRLPPRRIRAYVRRGLIRPAQRAGRAMLFGEAEISRLRRIRRLREDLGINLAGLEVVLRLLDEIASLRAALGDRMAEPTALPGEGDEHPAAPPVPPPSPQ